MRISKAFHPDSFSVGFSAGREEDRTPTGVLDLGYWTILIELNGNDYDDPVMWSDGWERVWPPEREDERS